MTETERKLRNALEFYANPMNHEISIYDRENDSYESAVERDGGYMAQTVLKEVGHNHG